MRLGPLLSSCSSLISPVPEFYPKGNAEWVVGLLFFTTYALLVLFWAEIYHQALNDEYASKLRMYFIRVNLVVYCIQV